MSAFENITVTNVTKRVNSNYEDRIRYSTFFITVSSQINPHGDPLLERRLENALMRGAGELFGDPGERRPVKETLVAYGRLLQFLSPKAKMVSQNDGTEDNIQSVFDQDKFKKIEVKWKLETGTTDTGGRVHIHIILKIEHRSRFHVRRDEIKRAFVKFLRPEFGVTNPMIYIKALGNQIASIEDYLEKGITSMKVKKVPKRNSTQGN
jgi:hypothetical protein